MNSVRSTASPADSAPRPVTPVGVLAERLATLTSELIGRSDIDATLRRELVEILTLAGGLESYVERQTSAPSDELARISSVTHASDWTRPRASGLHLEQEMLSGHVEGQLLQMLVAATRASRVLEIGLFTGYSALAMADALPADGVLVACEIDADVASLAQRVFDSTHHGSLIDVRVGPALDTLRELADAGEEFDLVFLDADKSGYTDYVDLLLTERLLAPHGLLCIDNTLMQGQPWAGPATANGQAIARFNTWLSTDPRVVQVLVPVRDGLTLARWATDPSS